MFPVEVRSLRGGDEELRSVGVGAGVSHGQEEWFIVFLWERLICELFAVDRLPTSPVSGSEITTLDHEPIFQKDIRGSIIREVWPSLFDHSMEAASFVVQRFSRLPDPLFSGTQSTWNVF